MAGDKLWVAGVELATPASPRVGRGPPGASTSGRRPRARGLRRGLARAVARGRAVGVSARRVLIERDRSIVTTGTTALWRFVTGPKPATFAQRRRLDD